MTTGLVIDDGTASKWERAIYAFLAEKERRSGSHRTVTAYSRMLQAFFGTIGKTPEEVTSQEVFAYAHGVGASGKTPSGVTTGARIACVSSFYRFLIRMEIIHSNPCDKLERPRVEPSPPRGLSAHQVVTLLNVVPDTPAGIRDRAIILTLVLTGRRRAEVLGMKVVDINADEDRVYYTYRGKGGKRGRRELPRPAYEAVQAALRAFGMELALMPSEFSIWPSSSRTGNGLTSGAFYGNLQRYFRRAGIKPAGVHILRHTAAKLRREAGEDIEDVSRFLDHSSLATTTVYLRRLEGEKDGSWWKVAEAIGIS